MAKEKQLDHTETTRRVEKAIEEYAEAAQRGEDTMVLSSGVEVKIRRLPPLLLQRLEEQFQEPEPPIVEVKVHGQKETQPNPDDPEYLKEIERLRIAKGWAYMDLVLLKGIEIEMPEDEEWLDELRQAGIEVGDSKAARRLAYMQSVLITDLRDLEEVAGRVLAMSGVTPRAVDEALKTP